MTTPREVKNELSAVSSCFCLAKWLQATIDLSHGTTHSCHHPRKHKIIKEELQRSPSALHNTSLKKESRKSMLEGIRPSECEYCWKIEDLGDDLISDRLIKSSDEWAHPSLQKIKQLPWDSDIDPTYLEVMFSNTCNLACMYCMSDISSSVEKEMKEFGPYPVSDPSHRLSEFQNEEDVDYTKYFWEWSKTLLPNLNVLRITGGEPLLTSDVFKIFETLSKEPLPNLTLSVNSNFSLPKSLVHKFCNSLKPLVIEEKIKGFELYLSIDTFGKQAEYIRSGLNYDLFMENTNYFLQEVPNAQVIFMVTFNLLSIPAFRLLLQDVLELKQRFKNVVLDTSYLINPYYLRANLAEEDLISIFKNDILFMTQNINPEGFSQYEVEKTARILEWIHEGDRENGEITLGRRDFARFITEYDKRKGFSFEKTFPELISFYRICRKENVLHHLNVTKAN